MVRIDVAYNRAKKFIFVILTFPSFLEVMDYMTTHFCALMELLTV